MALGYAEGSIAGVTIEYLGDPCKVNIITGSNFQLEISGSNSRGANGKVFTQIFPDISIPFGLEFEQAPKTVIDAIMTAVKTALLAATLFDVILADDIVSINHKCTWDFAAQPYGPQFPKQRTHDDYVAGYNMQLIAVKEL